MAEGVSRGCKETCYPKCLIKLEKEGNGMWLKESSLRDLQHRLQSLWSRPQEGIYLVALIAVKPGADEDQQEKCLSQLYDHMPEGLTPLATLKNGHQRRQLGTCQLSCSLPLQAPFSAQLVLLTDSPRQVPRAGPREQGILGHRVHSGSETMRRSLQPQQPPGAVFSQVL